MKRIGVFVCHCGTNIAGTVDIEKVLDNLSEYPGVVFTADHKYMCSDPGQKTVEEAIVDQRLEGVVIGACSPTMHESTFRKVAERSGLNPYQCEIANIREQCSWVHDDMESATEKATRIMKAMIEKVKMNESLSPVGFPVEKKCLVIGGGVAGIQSALDIADSGFHVYLVERSPAIGGHMAQLSETFPTLDCSQCILTPKMVSVSKHPNVELMTYCEVEDVSGYVGNFKVKILKKPRYVIEDKCNLCGECEKVCPQLVPSEFDEGLSLRKAIYIPFPQAVPATYTLDEEACLGIHPLRCDKCMKACEAEAIDYDMHPEIVEVEVGAIVVATGYDLYSQENLAEYGYGKHMDVIDGLQFERLLSASGPTEGVIKRPSDGKIPKEVVFVQCAGSRDPEEHMPYCSKICCMYTAKHALLYKHKVPDGQAYVFYIDIRAGGKDYEEFVQRAIEEENILYLRGKVSKIFRDGEKVMVWGVDTLTGKRVEIAADLVVLAMATIPSKGITELSRKLKIAVDEYGFLREAHPKLRPVESLTSGIFLAGAAQAPKDIPEAVGQGSGAASKAISILSVDQLLHEPLVAYVDENACSGCGICLPMCPYDAISLNERTGVAEINEILCEGCGSCVSACPSGAASLRNFSDGQIGNMISASLAEFKQGPSLV